MFRGVSSLTVDAKSRIALPSKYRPLINQAAGQQLVLTINTESPCLMLYPLTVWMPIEQQLTALPSFDAQANRIKRLLLGHAIDIELDKNSRFVVPPMLADYAHIDKKITLVGLGNKFELWSEQQWLTQREEWLQTSLDDNGELTESLAGLSL